MSDNRRNSGIENDATDPIRQRFNVYRTLDSDDDENISSNFSLGRSNSSMDLNSLLQMFNYVAQASNRRLDEMRQQRNSRIMQVLHTLSREHEDMEVDDEGQDDESMLSEEDSDEDESTDSLSDLEEDDFIKNSILKEGLGAFGLELYKRLSKGGLLRNFWSTIQHRHGRSDHALSFLRFIVQYFITNFENHSVEKFVSSLPSLDRLASLSKHNYNNKSKEVMVIKTVLELYENYLLSYDSPLFTDLQKLYDICIQFYSKISEVTLMNATINMDKLINSLIEKPKRTLFHSFKSSSEFVDYYKKQQRNIRNLAESTRRDMFIR
jgi:hypothetical protein